MRMPHPIALRALFLLGNCLPVFQESNGAGPFPPDSVSHVYHSVGHGANFGGETDGHIEVSYHEFCWLNSHQVVIGT
jgi:hypothetical protein